ncbi:transcriptional regulator [Desulfosarcina ovata subsp. sediminis]|uniref:Transcriptional regulator n=1 Tax=Desulfosarcina ovata subsp. sediminis TaxID=885957 RepID=A0A5K8A032_9BACT|nr:CerR family C-terminal domain-containing protein [Desulfosarcina ovata]BBO85700.1 transcriptional regulator [Desulfosarcina ovata subsp. sediminis]
MPNISEDKSVKQKILDAAGDVFGHVGYKAATTREICRAAGVNIASINYYFGSKTSLYQTVVTDLIARTFARYPVDSGVTPQSPPHVRLRAFINGALLRLLSPDGLSGYPGKGQLVARELADPSPFMDDLVNEFIRPAAAILTAIIAELLGPEANPQAIMRCQISVIGQCFHYATARPILSRLAGTNASDASAIDTLTDHITRFSLAGIESVRDALVSAKDAPAQAGSVNGETP